MKHALYALDIGGTKAECVRVYNGKIDELRLTFPQPDSVKDDSELVEMWLGTFVTAPADAVAVSFAGVVKDGRVLRWPNRRSWEGFNLRGFLERIFSATSVPIEDDANSGAIASRVLFPGRPDSIFVNVGTGIGCGIVVNGKVLRGERGFAGELGHTVVDSSASMKCPCGKRGCLQVVSSGRGMLSQIQETMPTYRRYNDLGVLLSECAGESSVCQVLERGGRTLGTAVANLVSILDIAQLHIGGSLSRVARFAEPFVDELSSSENAFLKRDLDIRLGPFRNASLIGALILALEAEGWAVEAETVIGRFIELQRDESKGTVPMRSCS